MSTIYERIRQVRLEEGISQVEFAERLGLSRGTVRNMEIGEVEVREQNIRIICEKFHISRQWLENETGPMYIPATDDTAELLDEKLATGSGFSKALLRTIAHMPDDQLVAVENFFVALQQEVQKGK